jgi:hypothetical protein
MSPGLAFRAIAQDAAKQKATKQTGRITFLNVIRRFNYQEMDPMTSNRSQRPCCGQGEMALFFGWVLG